MSTDTRDFEQYTQRVQPYCTRMYGIAYAITGSTEAAEYCLQCALLDHWFSPGSVSDSSRVFRDSLRELLVGNAMKESAKAETYDWEPPSAAESGNAGIVSSILSKESPENQRILVLRFGAGLSAAKTARLTDSRLSHVRSVTDRFTTRCSRKLNAPYRRTAQPIERALHEILSIPQPHQPEAPRILASLQADVLAYKAPSRLTSKALRIVLTAILAAVCMVLFWFAAVLLQPADLSADSRIDESAVYDAFDTDTDIYQS